MNEDKYITLLTEDGEEQLAEILFTFDYKEEKFVLMTPISEFENVETLDDEYEVFAYKYEETDDGSIGNLIEISPTNEDEWNVVAEMLESFDSVSMTNE